MPPIKKIKSLLLRKASIHGILLLSIFSGVYLFHAQAFVKIGSWLIIDDRLTSADAAVVLYTGVEYYPRLIEAAEIYRKGLADMIIINGNRKTDTLRQLEKSGFAPECPWYSDAVQILNMLGVPEKQIIPIDAEDVYDSITEAKAVIEVLKKRRIRDIIITTSKFHTRRAKHIWKKLAPRNMTIQTASAQQDPYDPGSWWTQGRQIRWVLAEYGAWFFYWWQSPTPD